MHRTIPKCFDQQGIYILDEMVAADGTIGVALWYDGVVARVWQEQREALRPRDYVINPVMQDPMFDAIRNILEGE